jgi:hypothetical protein
MPSLACGLTLCLHRDGGFCIERMDRGCCGHHEHVAAVEQCCDPSPAVPTEHQTTIGEPLCDCTHLALSEQPQATDSARRDAAIASHFCWNSPAAAVLSSGLPRLPTGRLAGTGDAACGPGVALSFLASVMLRC